MHDVTLWYQKICQTCFRKLYYIWPGSETQKPETPGSSALVTLKSLLTDVVTEIQAVTLSTQNQY